MKMSEFSLVIGAPDQSFDCVVGGGAYTVRLIWNASRNFWTLHIGERNGKVITRTKITKNTPLLFASNDPRLPYGGDFMVIDTADNNDEPTLDSLGVGAKLYWVDYE
ncbi:MAG: phage baseplate plug family protein [Vibrio sp.]